MTTTNADSPVPPRGRPARGLRSTRTTQRHARRGAWPALIVSALLELVWATAFAASEGLTRPLPVVVFLATWIASGLGLWHALRTARLLAASVVWVLLSVALTAVWALLTGVATSHVAGVAVLVALLGLAVGLNLLYRRRASARS